MAESKVIAETGAGQHGVALASTCALVGIKCEIHMGDIKKEKPNVVKMKIIGCVNYKSVNDAECLDAFMKCSGLEGIIPALKSAHAIAYAMQQAETMSKDKSILVNLSGRGDKDVDFVAERLNL